MTSVTDPEPGERLLFELRPHVSRLLGPALVLLTATPATALLLGSLSDRAGGNVIGIVLVGLWAFVVTRWVVRPFLTWWHSVTLITNRRIVHSWGLSPRITGEIPYRRVASVHLSSGILQRSLGCGTLLVQVGEDAEPTALRHLPRIEHVHTVVNSVLSDRENAFEDVDEESEVDLEELLDWDDEEPGFEHGQEHEDADSVKRGRFARFGRARPPQAWDDESSFADLLDPANTSDGSVQLTKILRRGRGA